MRIGFISDLHLGFGKEKEIYEDVFKIAEEIFVNLSKDCDVIFIAGDLFDEKDPNNETVLRTIQIFKKIEKKDKTIRFEINDKEYSEKTPVIFSIHGNHDRKFRDETSIYRIFEELGFFHYITFGKIVFKEEKICIHAMSNVPERYAKKVLTEKLNPKPEQNFFNILVLHQNIFPYVYSFNEESSLKIEDLPKKFNLIVNGHIHLRRIEKINESTLIILGSPIITQIKEEEIQEKRGYNIVEIEDINNFKIIFKEISKPRDYYLLEFNIEKTDEKSIENKILEIIENSKEKPVIKIKLFGKKEFEEKIIKNLFRKFEEKAILRIESLIEEEIDIGKSLELIKEKKSIDELITSILSEKLKEKKFANSFNFEKLIELFEDGDVDSLVDILTKMQKTIV